MSATGHRWQFAARFRRRAFGWRSAPAVQRVKEAISEIKAVARQDPLLAAEGAVRFLEKVSPALEQVDSSSGAIGSAVNRAIDTLVPIIRAAPADPKTRQRWLERLWQAHQNDDIPYIERLGDHWGELCASIEVASRWADEIVPVIRTVWAEQRRDRTRAGYFHGTMAGFSALLAAGRYDEILALLEQAPMVWWPYRRWGVRALAAQGKVDAAIAYAEASGNDAFGGQTAALEALLIDAGREDEAYERFAFAANARQTHLATCRALIKKYPNRAPATILTDLVARSPGQEGKWFATAKSLGLFDEAIRLANQSPCDPLTLTRAARDFADKRPAFARDAGLAALRWLVAGYGYEITGADVLDAYRYTLKAAEVLGETEAVLERIRTLVAEETGRERFVNRILGAKLGLPRSSE